MKLLENATNILTSDYNYESLKSSEIILFVFQINMFFDYLKMIFEKTLKSTTLKALGE